MFSTAGLRHCDTATLRHCGFAIVPIELWNQATFEMVSNLDSSCSSKENLNVIIAPIKADQALFFSRNECPTCRRICSFVRLLVVIYEQNLFQGDFFKNAIVFNNCNNLHPWIKFCSMIHYNCKMVQNCDNLSKFSTCAQCYETFRQKLDNWDFPEILNMLIGNSIIATFWRVNWLWNGPFRCFDWLLDTSLRL